MHLFVADGVVGGAVGAELLPEDESSDAVLLPAHRGAQIVLGSKLQNRTGHNVTNVTSPSQKESGWGVDLSLV